MENGTEPFGTGEFLWCVVLTAAYIFCKTQFHVFFFFPSSSRQMWTAVRSGSTVRVSSSRGTSIRCYRSCPAAPAPTPLRWRTPWSASMTSLTAGSSVGVTPAARRSAWTSTSRRRVAASARRSPATRRLSQRSTVVTANVGGWSHAGKARERRTWSAPSSRPSCTSKWMCSLGSCARETGVASTRCGHPIMDWAARKTPTKTCSWTNWKRPGSTDSQNYHFTQRVRGPNPNLKRLPTLKVTTILRLNHASSINMHWLRGNAHLWLGDLCFCFVFFRYDAEAWLSQS